MMNLTPEQIDRLGIKVTRRIRSGRHQSALRILQDNGLEDEARLLRNPPEQLVRHDLKCPVHQATVATNCRLHTCKFWVSSDMANNCLLAYCHQQQVDRLSADEIAYLYDQPVEAVKSELDSAMTTLRITAIQSDAANDPDIERMFWFVETTAICCVCGSPTDSTLIKVPDTPLAYCSKECQEEKPADVLTCEFRFGRPIATVVRWALHRFRNLPVLERTLGLKRETLIELCRRHLGRDLGSFFPKVKIQSERPPWRRRISRTEHQLVVDTLAQQTARQTQRFGRTVFGIEDLRAGLQAVLI